MTQPMVDRWGRGTEGLATTSFRALCRHWFRVEWEGLEHLPRHGGALLVANHAGVLPVDGGIVSVGVEDETGRSVYALAHHGFWRFPFMGGALERIGGVVGHPENAHRLLVEDKKLVLVFPEGSKGPVKPPTERNRLQRFGRGGFVETAMRAGVPIVPIALMGTEDTTPTLAAFRLFGNDVPLTWNTALFGPILGSVVQFPAKVRARVLEPVTFDEPAHRDRYPRSLLMDHAESIRQRIQSSLGELLAARRDVVRG